jgi:hypothetical protein
MVANVLKLAVMVFNDGNSGNDVIWIVSGPIFKFSIVYLNSATKNVGLVP